MEAFEHALVAYLQDVLQAIGWPGVVLIMALESANVPIPSEVPMPLAGWMLVQARGLSLWHAILLGGFYGALGCTIGSITNYLLGYYGGRPLLKEYGRYVLVNEEDLEQADRWFAHWGNWAVFLSRMVPLARTFISFPAGVTKLHLGQFTLFTFLGSFVWCALLTVAGYWFGSQWEVIRSYMRPFDIPILLALAAGLGYYVYQHVRGRKRS